MGEQNFIRFIHFTHFILFIHKGQEKVPNQKGKEQRSVLPLRLEFHWAIRPRAGTHERLIALMAIIGP